MSNVILDVRMHLCTVWISHCNVFCCYDKLARTMHILCIMHAYVGSMRVITTGICIILFILFVKT